MDERRGARIAKEAIPPADARDFWGRWRRLARRCEAQGPVAGPRKGAMGVQRWLSAAREP